jgi:hypothetical protein
MTTEATGGSPWLLLKAVVRSEIATASIRLPADVQEQVDDAYRRRRLARIRATTRKDITPVNLHKETLARRSKAEGVAAKAIRKSLAKSAARRVGPPGTPSTTSS